ncbi:MAG TPA: adenosine-specific kinase [Candidatus Methanomethylicus sp.]|nr:adenosine-specific kinase [Candidatus Methanomethylicus sp.]
MDLRIKSVKVDIPKDANVIIGQTHFIKSVEDIYEAINGSAKLRFGIAFAEASGPCLVRYDGNDEELQEAAVEACRNIGAGHTFVVFLREGYPINVLNSLKSVTEVCTIFCATANPLEIIIAEGEAGRGVLGVIDGSSPRGVEDAVAKRERAEFLRRIGYKR